MKRRNTRGTHLCPQWTAVARMSIIGDGREISDDKPGHGIFESFARPRNRLTPGLDEVNQDAVARP
jgi:hypothetical protein